MVPLLLDGCSEGDKPPRKLIVPTDPNPGFIQLDPKPRIIWLLTITDKHGFKVETEFKETVDSNNAYGWSGWKQWKDNNGLNHYLFWDSEVRYYRRQVIMMPPKEYKAEKTYETASPTTAATLED